MTKIQCIECGHIEDLEKNKFTTDRPVECECGNKYWRAVNE